LGKSKMVKVASHNDAYEQAAADLPARPFRFMMRVCISDSALAGCQVSSAQSGSFLGAVVDIP